MLAIQSVDSPAVNVVGAPSRVSVSCSERHGILISTLPRAVLGSTKFRFVRSFVVLRVPLETSKVEIPVHRAAILYFPRNRAFPLYVVLEIV